MAAQTSPPAILICSLCGIHPVEFIMVKVLQCNALVPACKFEARGICEEEVIAEFADHIATAHNMLEISDEIPAMISKAIREEGGVRTRFARA
jgi:predicted small metal-binding protein